MIQRPPQDDFDRQAVKAAILAALRRRRDAARTGEQPRPLPALVIARAFGVRRCSRTAESRKRGVRALIDELRTEGHAIVADFRGYRLAITAGDHADYQAFRRRMGLGHLVAAADDARSEAALDAAGQLSFEQLSKAVQGASKAGA